MSTMLDNCWGTDYWLRNCEGFRVTTKDGETGYVDGVDLTPLGEADVLLIRFGKEVAHSVRVPVRAVETLDPIEETIVLAPPAGRSARRIIEKEEP
jgi:hypothetical protein